MAGLAVPTAAAAAVTFGAAGAEVAMTTKAVGLGPKPTGRAQQAASADTMAQIRDRRNQAAYSQAQGVTAFRANAAAQAARSAQRKDLATRALAARLEAQRVARAHGWQMPITNALRSSGFGLRWGRMHEGEDYAVPVGTDLASMSTGTVVFAGQEAGFGNLVKIRYWDGTVTFYGHMSHISVSEGEVVEPGQVVGQSGNTGHSTGPHLHLEIHPDGGSPVDPLTWLANHSVSQ